MDSRVRGSRPQARGEALITPTLLKSANLILETLYGRIDSEINRNFGSGMLCYSASSIHAITVANRVLKKFETPANSKKADLRRLCFSEWIAHEEALRDFRFDAISNESKSVLYRASALLHSWFGDFRPDSQLVEFTPGESWFSMKGHVSIYQKLKTREAWTVTHDAKDDFIRLCYNNLSLKRCAKALMPKLTREQQQALYASASRHKHVGFACFRHMMEHFVITVVNGSRASSVKKNNTEDRFINVEPLGNMILQRQVAGPMRSVLARQGNDLLIGQQVHRLRIRMKDISTIDFSKASDSVILDVVCRLFPHSIVKYLTRYRSPFCTVDGVDYMPLKLSSMGCGFTFETMSTMLLAIARVFDPEATIYGDDVIIANTHASAFVKVAGEIGFKVNVKKTFIDSPFRESCGAFYHDELGYIKCYDFHYIENVNDMIITVNKLFLILENDPNSNLPECYRVAYEALLRLTPALLKGCCPITEPDSGYVYDSSARKKHMRSSEVATLRKRNQALLASLAAWNGVKENDILVFFKPHFVSKLASPTVYRIKDDPFRAASYLYALRKGPDAIRNAGRWVYKLHFQYEGIVTPASEVKRLVAEAAHAASFVGPHRQVRAYLRPVYINEGRGKTPMPPQGRY